MARTFGKLLCTTWTNPEFLALSNDAKVLYLAFVSQPDITPAGVVPLTERRWKNWLGCDIATVSKALDELAEGLFVVVDEDTAEVWIRSFIRYDQRLANSKLATTVHSAAVEIRSETIKTAAAGEIARFGDKTPDERAIPENQEGPSDPHTDLTVLVPVPIALVGGELEQEQQPGTEKEEQQPAAANSETAIADAAAAAIEILIKHRIARGGITNPDGFRLSMTPTFTVEHEGPIRRYLERIPDATPAQIANNVMGLTEMDLYRIGEQLPPVYMHGARMARGWQ